MKMTKFVGLCTLPLVLLSSLGHSSVISFDGTTETIDGNGDGVFNEVSIGQVRFTVESDGVVELDADITGYDGYMYVFNSDNQVVYSNNDGSLFSSDPYISGFFEAGDYLAAITMNMAGTSPNEASVLGYASQSQYSWFNTPGSDESGGTWALTITGDVSATAVPVPAALPLFASALAGLVGLRRRR